MSGWLFAHIMKTAGTSFRRAIEKEFGPSMYPTQRELSGQPRGWYLNEGELLREARSGRLDSRKLLIGHYPISLADMLPGQWKVGTIFREPVARTLSMIAHRRRSGPFAEMSISEMLSRDNFVGRQVRNYQTKILAINEPLNFGANAIFDVDDNGFEVAKRRLETLSFVGVAEDMAEAAQAFGAMLGVNLDVGHLNKSSSVVDATEEDIARIRDLVRYDLEIYDLARKRSEEFLSAA